MQKYYPVILGFLTGLLLTVWWNTTMINAKIDRIEKSVKYTESMFSLPEDHD